ncbi:MAG: HAD family hydrolase [Spirochaetaceae bacterium]|nr:HAD family hydrolase [Spirochaetaceae bacterium]
MKPEKEFFIGIDSDGCAFDTMEIKHKECFCPNFIEHFNMQAVSKYAREVWEFVNLYSKTRGCNRFHAVMRVLQLIGDRPDVKARGVVPPEMKGLADWIERETKLGNPTLIAEVERNPHPDLQHALRFSLAVNETIGRVVHDVPPFPLVRESLEKISEKADAIVVSQTPFEALKREWEEHKIDPFVRFIAGQEMGTKTEHIAFAAGGKYPREKMLMVGDAPGDLNAAKGNDALFFPVNPGAEEQSWKRFYEEGLDRFFAGTYAGSYEEELLNEFNTYLPEDPPWEV